VIVARVELSDDHCDVALEQAGADHDQREAEEEGRQRLQRHAEVPGRDQDAAVEHRAPRPEQPIGDPPARQARHVDARGVEAVDRPGNGGVEAQAAGRDRCRHEQDEQRPHPVVAEPLPHLGEEENGEAARMTEERMVVRTRVRNSRHGTKNTMIASPCAARS
jgi:hypothetical protein